MKPIHDFAQAQAFTGENEVLSVGGHICQIRGARCELSRNGKEMLVVAFDIKEGSLFDGYYKRRFDRMRGSNPDAKWPGVYYQTTTNNDGNTNPMFKRLITSIEESNPGYRWDWNENSLNGKLVGFNFGEEEYVHQSSGEIRTSVKPMFPSSTARVREGITPPDIKRLNNTGAAKSTPGSFPAAPAPTIPTPPPRPTLAPAPQQMSFEQVEDDDLPF